MNLNRITLLRRELLKGEKKWRSLTVILIKSNIGEDTFETETKISNYAFNLVIKLRKIVFLSKDFSKDKFKIIYNPHLQTSKQFKMANLNSSSLCLIIGENEFKNNQVSLKKMSTGEQITIGVDENSLLSLFENKNFE